jgi:hypothetical protein
MWEDYEGATDTFEIDLLANPTMYSEYFTSGALLGDNFRFTIDESSLNPIRIKKIIVVLDIESLY